MTEVYFLRPFPEEDDPEPMLRLILRERRDIYGGYRFRRDALMSLGSSLFKGYLERRYGVPLKISSSGKPVLEDSPIHFSISHSGGYVMLAVSDAPIGADIQERQLSNGLERKVFSPSELSHYSDDPDGSVFTMIWCRKESYLKMKGTGIIDDLSQTRVFPDADVLDGTGYRFSEGFADETNSINWCVCHRDETVAITFFDYSEFAEFAGLEPL